MDWKRLIKRRGDRIAAWEWNAVVRAAFRVLTGPGVSDGGGGWALRRLSKGSGGSSRGMFARITSASGTEPPFRYSAVEATMDEDGAWADVSGGQTYANVFVLDEQGASGQWVNQLTNDAIVLIFPAPDATVDARVAIRSHYRGTYN